MVGDFGSPDYQAPKNVKVLKKEAADRVSALLESGESPSDDWSNSRIANLWHKALQRKAKKEEADHVKEFKKEAAKAEAARVRTLKEAETDRAKKEAANRVSGLLASSGLPTPDDLCNAIFVYL
jgi:hypothetical protein